MWNLRYILYAYLVYVTIRVSLILITDSQRYEVGSADNFKRLSTVKKISILTVGLPIYIVFELVPNWIANLLHYFYDWIIWGLTNLVTLISWICDYIKIMVTMFYKIIREMVQVLVDCIELIWRMIRTIVIGIYDYILVPVWRCVDWIRKFIRTIRIKIYEYVLVPLWSFISNTLISAVTRLCKNLWSFIIYITDTLVWLYNQLVYKIRRFWLLSQEAWWFVYYPVKAWVLKKWDQLCWLATWIYTTLWSGYIWNLYESAIFVCFYAWQLWWEAVAWCRQTSYDIYVNMWEAWAYLTKIKSQ